MRLWRLACLAVMAALAVPACGEAGPQDAVQARRLMENGLDRERLGRHAEAVDEFTRALAGKALSRPDRVRAIFDRGVAYDAMGKTKAAIADYSAALRLDRAFAPALSNRANAYRRLGRLGEAKRDYLAALECPGALREYPYYGLGQIAESLGDSETARDYYLKAVATNPSFALAAGRLYALKPEKPAAPPPAAKPAAAKPLALLVAPKPAESQPRASPPPKPVPPQPAAPRPAAPKPPPVTERAPDPLLRQAILDTKAGRSASVPVQLGAFGSRDSALAGWSKIVAASGEALAGLSPAVVEVTLPGKGRLWRLRTGVADKAAAQALCAKLTSHGQACLLVRD